MPNAQTSHLNYFLFNKLIGRNPGYRTSSQTFNVGS